MSRKARSGWLRRYARKLRERLATTGRLRS